MGRRAEAVGRQQNRPLPRPSGRAIAVPWQSRLVARQTKSINFPNPNTICLDSAPLPRVQATNPVQRGRVRVSRQRDLCVCCATRLPARFGGGRGRDDRLICWFRPVRADRENSRHRAAERGRMRDKWKGTAIALRPSGRRAAAHQCCASARRSTSGESGVEPQQEADP
jgi:hypothetical protein